MSDMSDQKHLEPPKTMNLTTVAKQIHATTPNTKNKLKKLGLEPIQEITMPSGRVYTLYDADAAQKAIDKINKERLGYDPEILKTLEKQHQETQDKAKEDAKVQELTSKVEGLEEKLNLILEALTKPKDKS